MVHRNTTIFGRIPESFSEDTGLAQEVNIGICAGRSGWREGKLFWYTVPTEWHN